MAALAGLTPAGVLAEVVNDDGTMTRLPGLRDFADEHGLIFESIDDGPGVHDVQVDRTTQLAAIQRHTSQLDNDPVVCKVLALHGDVERVRIRRPAPSPK